MLSVRIWVAGLNSNGGPDETLRQSLAPNHWTLQKEIERTYTIPEPQTPAEVIGYYARRIAQDVKLPSQFAALAPKVREFLEKKAFGATVDLNGPGMVKAIGSNVAQYVTVRTFVDALGKLVVEQLEPQLVHAGQPLSETPPFPWSRPTVAAPKCVFNLVPCDNELEREFAVPSECVGRGKVLEATTTIRFCD
jgi:type III restriction enzyme